MSATSPEDMEGFAVCVDASGEVRRLLRVKPGSPTVAIVGDVMYVRAHLIDSLHGEPVWLYRDEAARPSSPSVRAATPDESARALLESVKHLVPTFETPCHSARIELRDPVLLMENGWSVGWRWVQCPDCVTTYTVGYRIGEHPERGEAVCGATPET